MDLYTLTVVHEEQPYPVETVACQTAAAVLTTISDLLVRHPDCHRIRVQLGTLHLFSVDCRGETVRD